MSLFLQTLYVISLVQTINVVEFI